MDAYKSRGTSSSPGLSRHWCVEHEHSGAEVQGYTWTWTYCLAFANDMDTHTFSCTETVRYGRPKALETASRAIYPLWSRGVWRTRTRPSAHKSWIVNDIVMMLRGYMASMSPRQITLSNDSFSLGSEQSPEQCYSTMWLDCRTYSTSRK